MLGTIVDEINTELIRTRIRASAMLMIMTMMVYSAYFVKKRSIKRDKIRKVYIVLV